MAIRCGWPRTCRGRKFPSGRIEIGLGQGYRPASSRASAGILRHAPGLRGIADILGLACVANASNRGAGLQRERRTAGRPPPIGPALCPLWVRRHRATSAGPRLRYRAGMIVAPLIELQHLSRQIKSFDDEAERQAAGPLPHALMREVLVGDSAADAIRRHKPYIDHVYRVQYAPERTGQTYIDPATGERKPLTADNPLYLSEAFMQDRWFLGTPAEIAAKMIEWLPRFSLMHFIFQGRHRMTLRHAVDRLEPWRRTCCGGSSQAVSLVVKEAARVPASMAQAGPLNVQRAYSLLHGKPSKADLRVGGHPGANLTRRTSPDYVDWRRPFKRRSHRLQHLRPPFPISKTTLSRRPTRPTTTVRTTSLQ